jgi:hypothetical protein
MPRATLLLLAAALVACSSSRLANLAENCTVDTDCGSGLICYAPIVPGVCTQACAGGSSCPSGSACAPLVTTVGNQLCLGSCASNANCLAGYTCCGALGNVCAPADRCSGMLTAIVPDLNCTPRLLVNGGVAGPPAQPVSCQKPVVSTTFNGAQLQVLGAQTVGNLINFDVPEGTGTISILQQVVDGGAPDAITLPGPNGTGNITVANAAVPFQLIGPDGGVFYDDDVKPNADLSTMEVVLAPEAAVAAMILPNTTEALSHEASGYPPGIWTMQVNDFAAECASGDSTTIGCTGGKKTQQYDIQIVTKPVMGATGTLDFGFYIVSDNWTAASAIADPTEVWRRTLDTIASIYARAGICLGKITFYDVPSWAKVAYATAINANDASSCGALDQMFTLGQPGGAIPIFFVDDIQAAAAGNGGTVVGIDGAIPGPPGAGGTVHSGALVNVSNITATTNCVAANSPRTCGPDEVGYITSHEAGHYLGLFHTTEFNGTLFDPIGDTSQCAPACDTDKDGTLTGPECNDDSSTTGSCGGADNTMFWLITAQAQGLFSPQQSRIIRANPVVY